MEEKKYRVQIYGFCDGVECFGPNYYTSELTLKEYEETNKRWSHIAIMISDDDILGRKLPDRFRNKEDAAELIKKQEEKVMAKNKINEVEVNVTVEGIDDCVKKAKKYVKLLKKAKILADELSSVDFEIVMED